MTEYVAVMWSNDPNAPERKVRIGRPGEAGHMTYIGHVEVFPAPPLDGPPRTHWDYRTDIKFAPAEWVTFPC